MSAPLKRLLPIAVLTAIADQISKIAILEWIMNPPQVIEILPVFNLVLAFNRGVSFSMLTSDAAHSQYLLSALAVLVCGALIFWARNSTDKYTPIAAGLIVGGALGNVIDRLRIGAVVDFLDVHWGNLHWPAFNIADSAIFIGAAILVLDTVFRKDEQSQNEDKYQNEDK